MCCVFDIKPVVVLDGLEKNYNYIMGNTGGRLKKIRKSLRRISLSRSKENLSRGDQTRRSISLMNLSVLKKNIIHKKKSKSTVLVSESYDQFKNSEDDKEILVITKSSSTSSLKTLEKTASAEVSEIQSPEGLEKNAEKSKVNVPAEEIDNLRIGDHGPRKLSLDLSLNNSSHDKTENETMFKSEKELIPDKPECSETSALKKIDQKLNNIEQQIEQMSHDDLLIHLPLLKDEIHFLWIKSYDVKSSNEEVYPKKVNTIEYSKKVLHKLYSKAFKQHEYCTLEKNFGDCDYR
ncbi:uncharacterized protein LOC123308379 [Coccinella septempunctata]|uniref:uncharacterized protein LOC123308379 n=1 Tax=Coccinella septempunctata TaxID=41139 RepID=UPI001D05DDF8|nr:uncharacterized protein LOC123308379 [Coccinella septempunctata]